MNRDIGAGTQEELIEFISRHRRLFVLTGAGCSTASGIPDYRDAEGRQRVRRPVLLQDFLTDTLTRKRYWARSVIGWDRVRTAKPNAAHLALGELESSRRLELLVTQNVDGLHQAAGSRNVVDLHGRLDGVRCMSCNLRIPRAALQRELMQRNPDFARLDALAAPDGDAGLETVDFSVFDVPACAMCGGVLKPDVVFFGERVPKVRVDRAMTSIETADAMLVVGSSLMVYSGYRFAKAMAEAGRPIAAINIGRTRADDLLTLKISDRCAEVLPAVVEALARVA